MSNSEGIRGGDRIVPLPITTPILTDQQASKQIQTIGDIGKNLLRGHADRIKLQNKVTEFVKDAQEKIKNPKGVTTNRIVLNTIKSVNDLVSKHLKNSKEITDKDLNKIDEIDRKLKSIEHSERRSKIAKVLKDMNIEGIGRVPIGRIRDYLIKTNQETTFFIKMYTAFPDLKEIKNLNDREEYALSLLEEFLSKPEEPKVKEKREDLISQRQELTRPKIKP